MHDEYCPMKDDPETCEMCSLIRMVRRDEQDKYSGDEEWDRQVVAEESYARGYAEASAVVSKAQPKVESVSLDKINQYILDGVSRRSVGDTEILYKLYVYLGGN